MEYTVRKNALNIFPHSILAVQLDGSNRNCPNQAAQAAIGEKFRQMRVARDLLSLEKLRLECRENISLLVSTGLYGRHFNYYCYRAVERIYDLKLQELVGWKFKDGRLKTKEDW